jgi:SAM-dependent methyltransferase
MRRKGTKSVSFNKTNMYDLDPYIAEIYDQTETDAEEVTLISSLVLGLGPLQILEPFCGTGRLLLPLALIGHELVGMDQARGMLDHARRKMAILPEETRRRITLMEADVVSEAWPCGFDLVILGGNCFYELATPGEQEGCIASAAAALKPGGHLYLDNNHMEGDLDEAWQQPGVHHGGFPTGTCEDGTRVEGTTETIWYDAPGRLWCARRTATLTFPDGRVVTKEWVAQKHPVSVVEQQEWLASHGFTIEHLFGDRLGRPYTESSGRGIFWATRG